MKETSVDYIAGDSRLSWYTSDPKWMRKIDFYMAEYPNEIRVDFRDDDGVQVSCPVSWFKPPKPPIKRNLTDEQKQAAADRMAKARAAISN